MVDLVLPPRRTAGDEFQTLLRDAHVALDACLRLTRRGSWNVGVGIGAVDEPVPGGVRAASGSAFVAARRAVDAAKRASTRCAVRVATDWERGDDVGPLLDLLLALRARRTAEGWEVYDLLRGGAVSQREAASSIRISAERIRALTACVGLVVRACGLDVGAAEPEVLRGGPATGVLERAAVVAAVAVGGWEIVAGVIAVKGLGRFSELAKGDAREQFIIGTLVSLLWAGLCAGLVWFGR